MRAWEIKNWNCGAKLKLNTWPKDKYVIYENNRWVYHYATVCENAHYALADIMNSNAVEEYLEPPSKSTNLTWQEAYDAWNNGWEVATTDGGGEYFGKEAEFSVDEIVNVRYKLTGKRR